jgi:hypothetical protein
MARDAAWLPLFGMSLVHLVVLKAATQTGRAWAAIPPVRACAGRWVDIRHGQRAGVRIGRGARVDDPARWTGLVFAASGPLRTLRAHIEARSSCVLTLRTGRAAAARELSPVY